MCDNGGQVLFFEGDSLLVCSDKLVELPVDYFIYDDISFSIGIGKSPSLSLLALKKAKGLGKKRVEKFLESIK